MRKSTAVTQIAAWCLYDWAAASFAIIVTTFIFATYFTTAVATNQIEGTYQWANATAIAGIIIALLSPLFGAIADYGGHHKRWLFFFTALCVVSTALLWFAYPAPHHRIYFTLACVVLGTIGLEVGLVFYNAFLPLLAPKPYLGRISGWGWGCGYLGGIFALTISLMVFIKFNFFGLDTKTAAQIRICGPFAAVWYAIFALPFFLIVPELSTVSNPLPKAVGAGWRELWQTLKILPQEKNILLYLIAHMIYADGLNTLFAFGGIYAAGTYGLTFEEVLVFGITMNVSAGLGAIALAWVDDYLGSKLTVIMSLIFLTILGIPILLLHSKYAFWSVALLICVFIGPVQSASRSLMVRLIVGRENLSTEMFGLYALSGRITAFIGPWLLGTLTLAFNSQRVGMATIPLFFALGALLMLLVRVPEEHKAA